jgi:hypothetical protein
VYGSFELCIWCISARYDIRQLCVWYISALCMIHLSSVYGSFQLCIWFISALYMMHFSYVWYTSDLCMIHLSSVYSSSQLCVWFISALCMIHLSSVYDSFQLWIWYNSALCIVHLNSEYDAFQLCMIYVSSVWFISALCMIHLSSVYDVSCIISLDTSKMMIQLLSPKRNLKAVGTGINNLFPSHFLLFIALYVSSLTLPARASQTLLQRSFGCVATLQSLRCKRWYADFRHSDSLPYQMNNSKRHKKSHSRDKTCCAVNFCSPLTVISLKLFLWASYIILHYIVFIRRLR